jgi:hypothetical protein
LKASVACGARLAILAAIMASVLYWPAGMVIVLCSSLLGMPAESLLTLGGSLGIFSGMLAWWLVLFALVLPCALFMFPWNVKLDGFRRVNDQ